MRNGENAMAVISAVKEKIAQISFGLPPGVSTRVKLSSAAYGSATKNPPAPSDASAVTSRKSPGTYSPSRRPPGLP